MIISQNKKIERTAMHSNEFVESYFDAWNRHDPQRVADHLTPDGIYRDVRQNAQRNHDELVEFLESFFRQYRHRYELIGDILTNGNTVAFQYQMISSTRARGQGPAVFQGAEFITLEDDSATLIADYYDVPEETGPTIVRPRRGSLRHRKYVKSGLTKSRMKAYMAALDHVMRQQEAYLDPELTLPLLAERVGCSVNHLSQVINAGYGMSFYDYVNKHRVNRAKRILNHLDDHAAVLKVAYSVGFNSNSAFYTAFKKRVGMTPAQFRRACEPGQ
jgi:AraC-like DNA-binding protein